MERARTGSLGGARGSLCESEQLHEVVHLAARWGSDKVQTWYLFRASKMAMVLMSRTLSFHSYPALVSFTFIFARAGADRVGEAGDLAVHLLDRDVALRTKTRAACAQRKDEGPEPARPAGGAGAPRR